MQDNFNPEGLDPTSAALHKALSMLRTTLDERLQAALKADLQTVALNISPVVASLGFALVDLNEHAPVEVLERLSDVLVLMSNPAGSDRTLGLGLERHHQGEGDQ